MKFKFLKNYYEIIYIRIRIIFHVSGKEAKAHVSLHFVCINDEYN